MEGKKNPLTTWILFLLLLICIEPLIGIGDIIRATTETATFVYQISTDFGETVHDFIGCPRCWFGK